MGAYLNYPKDDEDMKWWSSKSKVNRCLAIIAFSYDKENAIANLRRHGGYPHMFRHYHAWNNLWCYVNYKGINGSLQGLPFHDPNDPWYEVMPYRENDGLVCWMYNAAPVDYTVTKAQIVVVFSGIEGSGTASTTSSITGVNIVLSPVTGLKNGDTVTATVTPKKSGDTVNGKSSDSFTYTVSGLNDKLEWITPPPATGVTNTDYKATWKGGIPTYVTDIVGPVNLNPTDVTAPPYELTMSVDGTNQPVGSYVWTITSADGQSLTATTVIATANVPVGGVSVDKDTISSTVGDPDVQITATISPANATDKSVTWASSNTAVATVSQTGLVHFVSAGTANITVTTHDGNFTDTTAVTVTAATVPVTGVTLNKTSTSGVAGTTEQLTATVVPSNATNKAVTWSSNNANATVDANGLVTFVTAGSAVITVTTVDQGKTATCNVTITQAASASPVITNNTPVDTSVTAPAPFNMAVTATGTGTLDYKWFETTSGTPVPIASHDGQSSWTSSATTAGVRKFLVDVINTETGKSPTTLRSREATVTISSASVPVASVTIDQAAQDIEIGSTLQLSATVLPANATNKTVSWSADASGHVTVSASGLATAVSVGASTITVTTQDGSKTATVVLTGKTPPVAMTSMDTASNMMGVIGATHPAMPYHIEPAGVVVASTLYELDIAAADLDTSTAGVHKDKVRGTTLNTSTGVMVLPAKQADGTTDQTDDNVPVKVTVTDTAGTHITSSSDYHVYTLDHFGKPVGSHLDLNVGDTKEMTHTWDKADGWGYTFSNEAGTPPHYEVTWDTAVAVSVSDHPEFATVTVTQPGNKIMLTGVALGSGSINTTMKWGGVQTDAADGDDTGFTVA